jgi:hypothetical protein
MSAQGTVRYQVILDDAQATQTLNKFKTNLQTALAPTPFKALEQAFPGITAQFNKLQASVQNLEKLKTEAANTAKSVDTLGKSSTTAVTGVKALDTSVVKSTKSMKDMDKATKGIGGKIKDTFGKASGAMTGLSAAAANFGALERSVRDYGDAQIAVDRVTRRVGLSHEAVAKAQTKYNDAVKNFGKDSSQAKQAALDLSQAMEQERIQTQLMGEATENMRDIQQDMWIHSVGAIMGGIGGVTDALKAIGGEKGLAGLGTKIASFASKAKGWGGAIAAAIPWLFNPATAIVAGGLVLAYHILDQSKEVFPAFAAQGIILTKETDDINRSFSEMDKIMKVTGMGRMEILEFPEKAAKKFKEMNGQVDASGKVLLTYSEDINNDTRPAIFGLTDALGLTSPPTEKATTAIKTLGVTTEKSTTQASQGLSMLQVAQNNVKKASDGVTAADAKLAAARKDGNFILIKLAENEKQHAQDTFDQTARVYESIKADTEKNKLAAESISKIAELGKAMRDHMNTTDANSEAMTKNFQAWQQGNKVIPETTQNIKSVIDVSKGLGITVIDSAKAQEEWQAALIKSIEAGTKYNVNLGFQEHNIDNVLHALVDYKGGLVDAGQAEKLSKMSLEDRNATIEDAIRLQDEYDAAMDKGMEMMKERNKESREATDQQNLLNEAFGTHIKVGTIDADVENQLADVIKQTNDAYSDQEIELVKVLAQHKLLNPEIRKTIGNHVDNRNELNQAIIAGVKWTDALDGEVNGLNLVTKGTSDAVLEMEKFVQSAVENEAKTKAMDKMYEQLGNTMIDGLVPGMKLTVGQAQELGKSFGGDTLDNLKKVSDMIEGHVVESFSKLGSAFDALTKKDFKKGLKELNLGDILGKGFEKDVKAMGGSITEFNTTISDMETQFAALDALGADVQGGHFTEGVNMLIDNFQKLADSDPELAGDKIQGLFTKIRSMPPSELQQHAKSIGDLILAAKSGKDVNPAELQAFFTQFESENVSNIGKAATNTKTLGTNAADTAGPMGTFNKALTDSATAYVYFNNQLVKNPLTVSANGDAAKKTMLDVQEYWKRIGGNIQGLVPMLKANGKAATDAMKSVEVNWKGYANKIAKTIPKLKVDNSDALSKIQKVIDTLAKVKDKTVTVKVNTVAAGGGAVFPDTSIVSAAKGSIRTTSGPTTLLVGDNPGGRETVAAIPHDNPMPTLTALLSMFQSVSSAPIPAYKMAAGHTGKDMVINLYNVNNDRETMRTFKAGMGRDTYRFGA